MLNILNSVWIEIFLEFLLCFGGILASLFARIIKKRGINMSCYAQMVCENELFVAGIFDRFVVLKWCVEVGNMLLGFLIGLLCLFFVVNGEIMIEIFCCWKIIACGWK
jgi:hypothetical protein